MGKPKWSIEDAIKDYREKGFYNRIKACYNCEFSNNFSDFCRVKETSIVFDIPKALFCKYYTKYTK